MSRLWQIGSCGATFGTSRCGHNRQD